MNFGFYNTNNANGMNNGYTASNPPGVPQMGYPNGMNNGNIMPMTTKFNGQNNTIKKLPTNIQGGRSPVVSKVR